MSFFKFQTAIRDRPKNATLNRDFGKGLAKAEGLGATLHMYRYDSHRFLHLIF
jgi:hypothetical protein